MKSKLASLIPPSLEKAAINKENDYWRYGQAFSFETGFFGPSKCPVQRVVYTGHRWPAQQPNRRRQVTLL